MSNQCQAHDVTGNALDLLEDVGRILKPREKEDIISFAKKHVRGWNADLAHLLHEPARALTSRKYNRVIYVGPSRTSKTKTLVDCFIAYTVMHDPVDMAVFFPTENIASYFSKKRYDIDLVSSVDGLSKQIRPGGTSDNVYQKIYKSGNLLSFGWASKSQVAARDFVRVIASDVDRVSGDVGGEGDFFGLLSNRIKTYMSRGVALAESSPGKPITDPDYVQKSLHEAPPTSGILGLYNQGTRCLPYGQCPHCKDYFSPTAGIGAVKTPSEGSVSSMSRGACLICTVCGAEIDQTHERQFKRSGLWVGEGQEIHEDGSIEGDLIDSNTASYWQSGWFAAFETWENLVYEYLNALATFEKTGSEGELKKVVNTGFAAPYLDMARRVDMSPVHALMERAEDFEKYYVPDGGMVLLAAVDIQGGAKSRFVVQVHAYGVRGERWLVDRYSITQTDEGERISPSSNIEHWEYITHKVINATYKLGNDKELRVYRVAIDSGGEAGVTERAYEYWRGLKQQGLSGRVWLVKGGSNSNFNAPSVKQSYPDSTEKKDRYVGGRGDVPVLILNPIILKDAVKSSIDREEVGANYFHFPDWLNEWWYKELTAETRTPQRWVQVGKRNEAFDLSYYIHALWVYLGGNQIDWSSPPVWCQSFDTNTEVMNKGDRVNMKKSKVTVSRKTRFKFN